MARISNAIENIVVNEFLPYLRERLDVDVEMLISAWKDFNWGTSVQEAGAQASGAQETVVREATAQPSSSLKRPLPDQHAYTAEELDNLKIKDLKAICEKLRIAKGGVKQQLIDRILGNKNDQRPISFNSKPSVQPPPAKKAKQSDDDAEEEDGSKIDGSKISKILLEKFRMPDVTIAKNESGHWINSETKIVFTSDEEYSDGVRCRMAIGYEDEDGHVEALDAEKIELCNLYGFRYREPTVIAI